MREDYNDADARPLPSAAANLSRTLSILIVCALSVAAGNGAVWDVAIWPDPKQTWLLSADGENNEIRIIRRDDGSVVGSFGHNGRNAGQFHWVHAMAVDAKGNVYTAEVDTGKRIQKFRLTSGALR